MLGTLRLRCRTAVTVANVQPVGEDVVGVWTAPPATNCVSASLSAALDPLRAAADFDGLPPPLRTIVRVAVVIAVEARRRGGGDDRGGAAQRIVQQFAAANPRVSRGGAGGGAPHLRR